MINCKLVAPHCDKSGWPDQCAKLSGSPLSWWTVLLKGLRLKSHPFAPCKPQMYFFTNGHTLSRAACSAIAERLWLVEMHP